jgi:hypothetical protein
VELNKAKQITGRVLKPDLQPAGFVDVGLMAPGASLNLGSNGLVRENLQSGGSLLRTDQDGYFKITVETNIISIIAATPEGIVLVTPAELEARPNCVLQPWGSAELDLSDIENPDQQSFIMELAGIPRTTMSLDMNSFSKKVENGQLIWPHVPPMRVIVSKMRDMGNGHRGWGHRDGDPGVLIKSGETTKIQAGK